jgi:hypothetical protein
MDMLHPSTDSLRSRGCAKPSSTTDPVRRPAVFPELRVAPADPETTKGRMSADNAALYARPNDPRDLAEKVLELLADPDRRRAMGAAGLERIRSRLAWPHQAVQLLAAYDAAFAGGAA